MADPQSGQGRPTAFLSIRKPRVDASTEQDVLGNGIPQSRDELVLGEQALGAALLFRAELS